MEVRIWSGIFVVLMLAAPAAVAQPDFASTFAQLDADKDGVISFGELRYEGVEANRYAKPAGRYVTDDDFGVELWESPFGVTKVSMSKQNLATNEHQQARTYARDVRVRVAPWLKLAQNRGLNTMTLQRFESELREAAKLRVEAFDGDKDGAVSTAEAEQAILAASAEERRRSPSFQGGPGGDAMRVQYQQLNVAFYESLDLNDDGAFTTEEMLEVVLKRMVAAFAAPAQP